MAGSRLALLRGSFMTVLLIMALSFRAGISQDGDEDVTGRNVTRMRLLSYFPCTTARSPDECDVFAYAAAVLAVEEVNGFISSDSWPGRELEFELLPVSEANGDPDAVSFHSSELWLDDVAGVIGPFYPNVAARIVPIVSNNLDVPSITYAVTDTSIDRKGLLYRSVPSDNFLTEARLSLLFHFDWLKIGVLTSTQRTYYQEARTFTQLFHSSFRRQGLLIAYSGLFIMSESPERALNEMADPDIGLRIILGYFGPRDARRVICLANTYGLVSPDHVWILPSYSTPFWWVLSDAELQNLPEKQRCSNDQMVSLLQFTVFFSAVKLPPFDFAVFDLYTREGPRNTTGEQFVNNSVPFYDRLERKTQELFPELYRNGTQPLERYLYSSQAQRAYEATWLMSWSLTQVLRNSGNTQAEWLEITMYCEICRIYNNCLLLNEELLRDLCNYCQQKQFNAKFREWIQNYYGQVVASQYTGGFSCPVVIFLPISPSNIELVSLSDSVHHCYRKSFLLNESMPFNASCPLDFRWKGNRTAPPFSGYSLTNSSVSHGVIFVAVIASLVSIYGSIILVINIAWRKNIFIKATSPRVNILLIAPLVIMPWNALLSFIEYSALSLNISLTAISVMCQLKEWVRFSSLTVFYATLLVKNLRVYRIFHNQRLVSKMRWMSDVTLVLQVLLSLLPVLILLIVWTAVDPNTARAETFNQTGALYDYNFINISYCSSRFPYVWYPCLGAYTLSAAGLATMFGFLNSHIPARYREESAASYRVVAMLVSLLLIDAIITTYLFITRLLFATLLWISTLSTCGFAVAALTTLFVPKFVQAYLVHKKVLSIGSIHTAIRSCWYLHLRKLSLNKSQRKRN